MEMGLLIALSHSAAVVVWNGGPLVRAALSFSPPTRGWSCLCIVTEWSPMFLVLWLHMGKALDLQVSPTLWQIQIS